MPEHAYLVVDVGEVGTRVAPGIVGCLVAWCGETRLHCGGSCSLLHSGGGHCSCVVVVEVTVGTSKTYKVKEKKN